MAAQRTAKRFGSIVGVAFAATLVASGLAACATPAQAPAPHSTEVSPSGDIPDNQAFVQFTAADGSFSLTVPEGWSQTSSGSAVSFTDKLNSITVDQAAVPTAPTVDSATKNEVAAVSATATNFSLTDVKPFTRAGGDGILITYLADSTVNSVTASAQQNQVEEYLFWKGGEQVTMTLASPKGADNVDPWAKVTGSFAWLTK